nr:MAG TPA: hypothetical protein [Caudoviricetes sp.]
MSNIVNTFYKLFRDFFVTFCQILINRSNSDFGKNVDFPTIIYRNYTQLLYAIRFQIPLSPP